MTEYIAKSVRFDGTAYLTNGSILTTDSNFFATSFWITTGQSNLPIFGIGAAPVGGSAALGDAVGNNLTHLVFSVEGAIARTYSPINLLTWVHIFFAADTSNNLYALYVNGQRVGLVRSGDLDAFAQATFNGLPFSVGGGEADSHYYGELLDLWIGIGLDCFDDSGNVPSDILNRFISAVGTPKDPTGFLPAVVLLTGNEFDFIINRGTGGELILHGDLHSGYTVPRAPPPSRFYDGDQHVRRDGSDYAAALLSLLPKGQAWPKASESVHGRVVRGLAEYWGYVDGRAGDLLEREADPRITMELLTDWERNWGLPDPCFAMPQTVWERQRILVLWMTLVGAQSRAFFKGVAEFLGYQIRIREYSPWMVGVSEVGLTNDGTGYWRWEIGPPELRFYWTALINTVSYAWWRYGQAEIGIDPHLRIGIPLDLECMLRRWKPAQTELIFDYSSSMAIVPDQGNLFLSSIAPVITANNMIAPPQGILMLSATAPLVVGDILIAPSQNNLFISSFASLVWGPRDIIPGQGLITISRGTFSVKVNRTITPAQDDLLLSTSALTVGIDKAPIVPAQGVLHFSTSAPTVV